MGFTIGMPSLKLNNVGGVSKHRGDFRKVADEALQERRGLDADINPDLADENIYIGFTTAEELIAYSAQHIKEINEWRAANGERPCDRRKLKADTVVMCSTIIKPPAEMMLQMPKEMQELFLRDALDIFKEFVGAENVKSAALHFDELVPHMHIFWEPMTDEHRICAKDMHNLKFFGKLNTEMPQKLRDKGWTMVDDCDAYDAEKVAEMSDEEKEKYEKERIEKRKSQGKSSKKFKHEMEKESAELQAKIEEQRGILSAATVKPRPQEPEPLPAKPTRKERKNYEAQIAACKEWDTKDKLIQAAQITQAQLEADRKKFEEKKAEAQEILEDAEQVRQAQIRTQNIIKADRDKLEADKKIFDSEKANFIKNKDAIVAIEARKVAEQILEANGYKLGGYGVDEQMQQAQLQQQMQQHQKGGIK